MMNRANRHRRWFIVLTFIVALALDILPLPSWVKWLRPYWSLLVLIYWVMALPNVVSFFSAFSLGIILDLLSGTLLGEHAFALVVITYFMLKCYQLIRVYPLMQQTAFVFLFIFSYQIIIFIIQGFLGELPHAFMYWWGSLISTLLWPWVFILLRDGRRKLNVR